jgi:ribosome-binding protein aMBF1 (putative translation factor)
MAGGNVPRLVPINELGLRIGEGHHNVKLTDAEVERIRSLHEDDGMSYDTLAEKYEVSKWCIGRICRYERRAQTPAGWKTIEE